MISQKSYDIEYMKDFSIKSFRSDFVARKILQVAFSFNTS